MTVKIIVVQIYTRAGNRENRRIFIRPQGLVEDFRISVALTLIAREAREIFLSATPIFRLLVWRCGLGVALVQFRCGARKFRCGAKEMFVFINS